MWFYMNQEVKHLFEPSEYEGTTSRCLLLKHKYNRMHAMYYMVQLPPPS